MTTATISGQEMFSLGHVCAMTRRGPNAVIRVAKAMGILPVVSLNGVAYFNADDIDAIADKFRQMDAEQAAKDAAKAKADAAPKTLPELLESRAKFRALLDKAKPGDALFFGGDDPRKLLAAVEDQIAQLAAKGK